MVYKIVSDKSTLEKYTKFYFIQHPKAKKEPIKSPIHPSINIWSIMPRLSMNGLKQKWKDYTVFLAKYYKVNDLKLEKFSVEINIFLPTRRRSDTDNYSPKFVMDGLVEAGVIVDDDYLHANPLTITLDYDSANPRMEIILKTVN